MVDNIERTKYEPIMVITEVIGDIGESIQLTEANCANYEWKPNADLNFENC